MAYAGALIPTDISSGVEFQIFSAGIVGTPGQGGPQIDKSNRPGINGSEYHDRGYREQPKTMQHTFEFNSPGEVQIAIDYLRARKGRLFNVTKTSYFWVGVRLMDVEVIEQAEGLVASGGAHGGRFWAVVALTFES